MDSGSRNESGYDTKAKAQNKKIKHHKLIMNWRHYFFRYLVISSISVFAIAMLAYTIWWNTGIDKLTEENRVEASGLIAQWGGLNALIHLYMQDGSGVCLVNSSGECYMESVGSDGNQQVTAFLANGNAVSLVRGFETVKGCSPIEIQVRLVGKAESISKKRVSKLTGYKLGKKFNNCYGYVASIYGSEDILDFFENTCGISNADYILSVYGVTPRSKSELMLTLYSGVLMEADGGSSLLDMVGEEGFISSQLELIVDGSAYMIYSCSTVGLCFNRLDMGTEIYRVSPYAEFEDAEAEAIAMDFMARVMEAVGSVPSDGSVSSDDEDVSGDSEGGVDADS